MYLRIAYCVSDAYIPRMSILINSKYYGESVKTAIYYSDATAKIKSMTSR